jgi:predicted nucleic acid-binding protein
MRWCFEDTSSAYSEKILQQLESGGNAVAPILWRYEVVAVLAKAERTGAISPEKSARFITALRSFDIAIDQDGSDRVLTEVHRLAVTYRLTGYDAVYLELAIRKNLPLATLDAELLRACQTAGAAVFT